ncbi:exodeoxyribonuclease VII small subunit [Anaerococcus obesiensis]|uniref:exodeoxyribonuclease VII small subunit n=1 Tax=Anaerococcus obesiensis TaxID=1287640 RepID=UPI0039943CF8
MMDNTFEANYKKMESLLKDLEENKDNIDKSLEIYKEAKEIDAKLNKKINDYKAKVEIINNDKNE